MNGRLGQGNIFGNNTCHRHVYFLSYPVYERIDIILIRKVLVLILIDWASYYFEKVLIN